MAKRDRRHEIMLATEKLFADRRFHEITLDDVVHEAGVGKGTVYRYFKDKDDLFFQTAMSGFDELCALLQSPEPGNGEFVPRLLGACERISTFFRGRRRMFRMMQSEELRARACRGKMHQEMHHRRDRLGAAVADILKEGADEGAVRKDIDPRFLAGILMGMLRTYAHELKRSPDKTRDLNEIITLFLEGAGPKNIPQDSAPEGGE